MTVANIIIITMNVSINFSRFPFITSIDSMAHMFDNVKTNVCYN